MAQAKSVADFMERHAEQVGARPDGPAFVGVEVHVSGDGLGVQGGRIERMRQHVGGW